MNDSVRQVVINLRLTKLDRDIEIGLMRTMRERRLNRSDATRFLLRLAIQGNSSRGKRSNRKG